MKEQRFFMYTNPLFWVCIIPFFIVKLIFKKGYIKDLVRLYKFKRNKI